MDCDTYHELIVADLDDTLSPSEGDAVRAHLGACAVCRNARALEGEFAAYLRRGPRLIEAPHAVQERLRAAIARAPLAPAPRRTPVAAVVAALLIAITAGVAVLRPSAPDYLRPVTDDYRLAASARLPLDLATNEPATLAGYFDASRRLSFSAAVPDLTPAGYRLLGGAIRERAGVVYAVTVYERDGEIVLCHQFRDGSGGDRNAGAVASSYLRADDLGLWVTRRGGVVCCVTSRLPAAEVERSVLPLITA